ncbi:DUF2249 domain-containing protein [Nibribacter ruber]|uniref:DUF2249 domain-containing protein n=1 Tax=Nibribacter ruber TaxID=2698458 RepID=A0A6P1NTK2_9BACT|nr:DUF2249 domain-containing protein [Nibribacter ruber]QHL86370.1 DUF2249 domain-containing protein [Nibribacter ruber]
MEISATTKISALIKENPSAIDAIASINRHFEKLKNPVLRKILASRVTIADAARIGGCEVALFFEKLAPLGFNLKKEQTLVAETQSKEAAVFPAFLAELPKNDLLFLDVREDIETGQDPFLKIMKAADQVNGTNALAILNSFEPTPLIQMLQKRGFKTYVEKHRQDLFQTYFWLEENTEAKAESQPKCNDLEFDQLVAHYVGKTKHVDVRGLEMPQPMITILHELEWLPTGHALFVIHKRVPQFLLPKLEERACAISIAEQGPSEVHLLIYKPE